MTDVDPALSLVRLIERGADVSLDPLPASVTVVRRADGDPGDRLASLLEAASSVVAVVPQLDTTLLADRSMLADDTDARIVLTGVARERVTGASGGVARAALTSRAVDWYVHDAALPVGFLLADDRAAVGAFDDGRLSAVALADHERVCAWVAATCRRTLAAAEPLQ